MKATTQTRTRTVALPLETRLSPVTPVKDFDFSFSGEGKYVPGVSDTERDGTLSLDIKGEAVRLVYDTRKGQAYVFIFNSSGYGLMHLDTYDARQPYNPDDLYGRFTEKDRPDLPQKVKHILATHEDVIRSTLQTVDWKRKPARGYSHV